MMIVANIVLFLIAYSIAFCIVSFYLQKKEEKAREQYHAIKRVVALSRLHEMELERQRDECNVRMWGALGYEVEEFSMSIQELDELNEYHSQLISKLAQQLTDKDGIETIELPDGTTYQVMKGDNHDS